MCYLLIKILVPVKASTTFSPYTVAILNKGNFICNGAIIHDEHILTSASCVNGIKPSELVIRAGSENYDSGGVQAEVVKIIVHKKYTGSNHDYNVAVLKLKGCLAISSLNIEEIPISEKHIFAKEGLVTGWLLNDAGPLQFYKVDVHRHSECEQLTVENVTKRMLCAGTTKDKRCIDFPSGSPLVAKGKLIGIKSFGFGCNQSQPDIFTNIYVFFKFIQKIIKRST